MSTQQNFHESPSAFRKQRQRAAQTARESMLASMNERMSKLEQRVDMFYGFPVYNRTSLLEARNLYLSPAFEPEVEQSPEKPLIGITMNCTATAASGKMDQSTFSNDSPFMNICRDLDVLHTSLSEVLYSDTMLDRNSLGVDVTPTADHYHVKTVELTGDIEQDFGIAAITEDFQTLRNGIRISLEHLEKASNLAIKVEKSFSAPSDSSEAWINQFLEDYYALLDPKGIAERLLVNEDIEQELEDIDVNFLGHLFVFSRQQFQEELEKSDSTAKHALQQLAAQMPPSAHQMRISQREYETIYWDRCEEAHSWQEEVPDSEDDENSVLIKLLRAIRQHVRVQY
jgi:hypothetical protein